MDDDTKKFIRDSIRYTVEAYYWNRVHRSEAARYYDGLHPRDDYFAAKYEHMRDVRINLIRSAVDTAIGELMAENLQVRVVHAGGVWPNERGNDFGARVAAHRDFQVKASMDAGGYSWAKAKAIQDSVKTGEGFVKAMPLYNPNLDAVSHRFYPKDWQEVWPDPMSQRPDLMDAEYIFEAGQRDKKWVTHRFPKKKDTIESLAKPMEMQKALDYGSQYQHGNGGVWGDIYSGNGIYEITERDGVLYGEFYWRDNSEPSTAMPLRKIKMVRFVADRGLAAIEILDDTALTPMDHNFFPFVRMRSAAYDDSRLPYSPLIAPRMGLERMVNYVARNTLGKLQSKSYMISEKAIPTDIDGEKVKVDDFLDERHEQLSQPNYIVYFKDISAEAIREVNTDDAKNGIEFLGILQSLHDVSGNVIHKGIRGQESNVTAYVALDKLARQAKLGLGQIFNESVELTNQLGRLTLANIQEYPRLTKVGALVTADDRVVTLDDEIAELVENANSDTLGISLQFNIIASERLASLPQETQMLLEFIKQTGGNPLGFVTMIAHYKQINPIVADTLIEVGAASGIPIPDSFLNPKMRDEIKKARERQEQERLQEMELLAMRERAAIAEIDSRKVKNLATAEAAMIKAEADAAAAGGGNGDEESRAALAQSIRREKGQKETIAMLSEKLQNLLNPPQVG